jgi:hypothetical protein
MDLIDEGVRGEYMTVDVLGDTQLASRIPDPRLPIDLTDR